MCAVVQFPDDLAKVDALAVKTYERLYPFMLNGSPMYVEHLKVLEKPIRDLVLSQHLREKPYYTQLLRVAAGA